MWKSLFRQAKTALETGEESRAVEAAAQLMEIAQEAISDEDFDTASQIGSRLREIGFTGGFEILAAVHGAKEGLDAAIEVLREGVLEAPENWNLWHQLGCYLSESGQYEEAHQALDNALSNPKSDNDLVLLNKGTVYARQGMFEKAVSLLEKVEDERGRWRSLALRIECLRLAGRKEESLELARESIESEDWREASPPDQAMLWGQLAVSIWEGWKDTNRALNYAWQAIAMDKTEPTARWLIREIEAQSSQYAKTYEIVLEGVWPVLLQGTTEKLGFFATYLVFADDPDEAFQLAVRFEPEEVRETLTIDRVEVLDIELTGPKGVYNVHRNVFFPMSSKEESES